MNDLRMWVIGTMVAVSTAAHAQTTVKNRIEIIDFKTVTGRWEGTMFSNRAGLTRYTLTISEDGAWVGIGPDWIYSTYKGKFKLVNGRLCWETGTPIGSMTGTDVLWEANGQRILEIFSDDASLHGELSAGK